MSSNSAEAVRSTRLNKLFGSVLQGKRIIKSLADAKLFIEAVCHQSDHLDCVEKLAASSDGLIALKTSLRIDVSLSFFNEHIATFLQYISEPTVRQVCNGQYLKKLLVIIADPPTLWNALVALYKDRSLNEQSLHAFAWLLLELVSLLDPSEVDVLSDAQSVVADGFLLSSQSQDIKTLGYKIQNVLQTKDCTIPVDPDSAPGGRHDNDPPDFRQIAILPTADEIRSKEKPFYRQAEIINNAEPEHRIAMHLDNQFRLLREEMLAELRDNLQDALRPNKRRRSTLILDEMSVIGVFCGDEKKRTPCALTMRCQSGLEKLNDLPPPPSNKRADFLRDNRNFLKHESFGCILQGTEILAFATVDRREDALVRDPPSVMLRISGTMAFKKVLFAHKAKGDLKYLSVDTPVFAFEPILKCLQEKAGLPLAAELFGQSDLGGTKHYDVTLHAVARRLKERSGSNIQDILKTEKAITLDMSQMDSLISGLTTPLSLIQGPPGTGKSFIGALLAKVFHDYTSHTILVVCYKNHALDQFLEDFLDIGIPPENIVRLGSKSTARTASLSLRAQKISYSRSKNGWGVIDKLKAEATELEGYLSAGLQSYSSYGTQSKEILEYLEFSDEGSRFYDALHVPDEEDEMIRVDRRGKAVGPGYLFDLWSKGDSAGVFAEQILPLNAEVWSMSYEARRACVDMWTHALLQEQVENLCGLKERYDRCETNLQEVFAEGKSGILRQKRVIGCTTSAAAMYTKDLQNVSPGIILVEEAAEILEAHVLTAISSETKQLVLIGDHKQLRPRVNNHALTVEKGDGYDLNISLFERLVLAGYPHSVLTNQHRMCPEISCLVRRLTYPDLQDDQRTLNREEPRGLQDRVVFFNHKNLEEDINQIADRRDEGSKGSKQNAFEVGIVLKTVKYLAQQGYGTDKLVVLTPYLGQLKLLQEQLSKENDPILNDLDSSDLIRAGLLSRGATGVKKRPIRISTIDNYQGEESEIVIASLARSNKRADIGFMAAPQRLNVLLSRARNALIMIGNADTFKSSRKGKDVWVPFLTQLVENRHIYDGLPIKCEQHPQRTAVLEHKEDFVTNCPDGGCSEPCGTKLSCGLHDCPQKCHQLFDHSPMKCETIIKSVCPRKHEQSQKCFVGIVTCRMCEREKKKEEQRRQRDHDLETEREIKKAKYQKELNDIQDEIALQRRQMRERSEREEREKVVAQHQEELSGLKEAFSKFKNRFIKDPDSNAGQAATQLTDLSKTSQSGNMNIKADVVRDANEGSDNDVISKSQKDWEYQKEFEGAHNDALDSLIGMIGLEEVKEKFLSIKSRVDTALRQDVDFKDVRFSAALLGNPGTGKTTVARLYAKFLTVVGALPGNFFVETTGSKLSNIGVSGCKTHMEDILNNGGGVFFIDEAYQLTSGQNYGGPQVLDYLLAEVENLTGKVVFVLAGYNKQMEKFFAHNPGIPSRFPNTMQFADYSDNELLKILALKIDQKYRGRMGLEDGLAGLNARIVSRRIGRGRGREGFGNARAVENVFAQIAERQAQRLKKERRAGTRTNDMIFNKEDLIGPEPSHAIKDCEAWTKLQDLIGLQTVKESVESLFQSIQYNYERELEEKPIVEYSLNRVFVGSPGTGKTSVAKLYGQILVHIGMLSNGEVVVKNPADFIGSALGQSESNTKGILDSTIGKVLVIDEAYGLCGAPKGDGGGSQTDPFKTAVVDTIVAEVQSTPGEDRCVLLLGYKDQMEDMFQKVNPGLSRRFPMDSAFVFEDFNDDELGRILDLKLKQQGFETNDQGRKVALDVLRRARNRPHFGNAGEIDNLLNSAKAHHQRLLPKKGKRRGAATFEAHHFDEDFDRGERAEANVKSLFEGFVGCDNIVAQLEGYQLIAKNSKSLGLDARDQIPFNFLFRGPPGTGKTTTARKMGKVYYDMGFLAKAEVIESSATELIGQYVGQTGPKTQKVLENALGKILLIDEAYRLAEGHFAKEALDEIVDCITKPKFTQRLIIILAGYDEDINRLMAINPGLTSRFSESLTFRPLHPIECSKLLSRLLHERKDNMACMKMEFNLGILENVSQEPFPELLDRFQQLTNLPNWANARDVQTLAKGIFGKTIKSASQSPGKLSIEESTIIVELDAMIVERANRSRIAIPTQQQLPPQATQQPLLRSPDPPIAPSTTQIEQASSVNQPPHKVTPSTTPKPIDDIPRDAGVSDEAWARLQLDKVAAEDQERAYNELLKQEAELQKAAAAATEAENAASKEAIDTANRLKEEARIRHVLIRRKKVEQERLREKEVKAQRKLEKMGVCCAGFQWIKQPGGYCCAGGSHFVGDAQLGLE